MRAAVAFVITLFFLSPVMCAQEAEIDRLMQSELKMTFPCIYFRHNSTDYAAMPYTVDSCFRYIAAHFKDNYNDLVIWRDTFETEELTKQRVQKLKTGLRQYIPAGKIEIRSMGTAQKVSRRTINMTSDSAKIAYLLSLNSVFDVSKTHFTAKKKKGRRLVWAGWKHGFHWSTPG